MNSTSIGAATASSGATYNFTNVTNAQFSQQINSLSQAGKLSTNQRILLTVAADGGDSVPIDGTRISTAQALSDPTSHNFISEFQDMVNQYARNPGLPGAALYNSTLQILKAYQGKPINDPTQSISLLA
jgi:hypothetical protein